MVHRDGRLPWELSRRTLPAHHYHQDRAERRQTHPNTHSSAHTYTHPRARNHYGKEWTVHSSGNFNLAICLAVDLLFKIIQLFQNSFILFANMPFHVRYRTLFISACRVYNLKSCLGQDLGTYSRLTVVSRRCIALCHPYPPSHSLISGYQWLSQGAAVRS